jgi:hypothetical protein
MLHLPDAGCDNILLSFRKGGVGVAGPERTNHAASRFNGNQKESGSAGAVNPQDPRDNSHIIDSSKPVCCGPELARSA